MNVISYSIFGHKYKGNPKRFEFLAYIRGLYWNIRINALIYPNFKTVVYHSDIEYTCPRTGCKYLEFLLTLKQLYDNVFFVRALHNPENTPSCKRMLDRLRSIYIDGVDYVLCRDADAITTYREARFVQEFLSGPYDAHGINDNPAHSIPMMGGMIGIKTAAIKAHYPTFEDLIDAGIDLSVPGSDQTLIMARIYPIVQNYFLHSKGEPKHELPHVNPNLWESNLTCRHIGSAGVVDLETIRFFERFDPQHNEVDFLGREFVDAYPEIFYWLQ